VLLLSAVTKPFPSASTALVNVENASSGILSVAVFVDSSLSEVNSVKVENRSTVLVKIIVLVDWETCVDCDRLTALWRLRFIA
jgi:hypothetical protein